MTSMPYLSAKV